MALSNDPVFAQTPKYARAAVSAANTDLTGATAPTELLTAGPDGALVTSLKAWGTVTSTAKRLNVFISTDNGTTWKLFDSALMAAYTVANTTVQTPVTFVDKTKPDAAIRLPGGSGGSSVKLGVATMVAEAVEFACEYTNF